MRAHDTILAGPTARRRAFPLTRRGRSASPRQAIHRRRSSCQGFTLVELMVVIGIIAVLISILLPSLGAVRQQMKVSSTRATLSVIETGIQAFQADTRCGGSLPPSSPPRTNRPPTLVKSPHDNQNYKMDGANLLAWALVGADLMGTPGFTDLDGSLSWANDTDSVAGLYAMVTTVDRLLVPAVQRSGPFIDVAKVKLPQRANLTSSLFVIPAAVQVGSDFTTRCSYSRCFLDSFDQPILYYRAILNMPRMAEARDPSAPLGPGVLPATYNLWDNFRITGMGDTTGMNLGGGDLRYRYPRLDGQFHYLASLGNATDPAADASAGLRTFSRTVWNPNVTAPGVFRPHNDRSFILLSAGADGIFGTSDDLANFEVNR